MLKCIEAAVKVSTDNNIRSCNSLLAGSVEISPKQVWNQFDIRGVQCLI